VIFPGCAARAALKVTLEKGPTDGWIIGSNDSSVTQTIQPPMAKKQTGLSNRSYVATFFLFLVLVLLACTRGTEPSAAVPADCQQFLDKYFDAWKSKDIATMQTLSYYLSPEDRSRLPEGQPGDVARREKQTGG
jgi:hypothetical protein